MSKSPSSDKKKVPEWARKPFQSFCAEARRLGQLVSIAAQGIGMFQNKPEIVELLSKLDALEKDIEYKGSNELEDARKEAELAKQEVKSGFPVLHAWAVVGIWALLESTIRSFVAQWIKHKKSVWASDQIKSIRVQIGEYEALPREQRHLFIVELLERDIGSRAKRGVSRFESMMKPLGLSGEVPEGIRKTIYELSQVRNLIAHSTSVVDRRFVSDCPWLNEKVGEKLCVTAEMFGMYSYAAIAYILLLRLRVGENYGDDVEKEMTKLAKDSDGLIKA